MHRQGEVGEGEGDRQDEGGDVVDGQTQQLEMDHIKSEADIGDDSAGLMEGEGEGEEEALLEGKGAVGLAVKVAEEEKSDSEKGVVYLRMEEVPTHVIVTPSITHRHPSCRVSLPDQDIQIAELSSSCRSLGTPRTGVLALCGPNPTKISLICLVLISVWISWVFVIHLNKEMSDLDSALAESRKEIDRLHLAASAFRKESESSIIRLEDQLTKISRRKKGGRKLRPLHNPSSQTNQVS